ncbi:hypothetical protein LPJ66_001447 [Kickxella alabastrina]|uniref:Uncharacterized protein n=1 Tax=Kickxella alabastrina TaxID=61397 RepID=A0ACC1IT92_9FUNG|nr:hypothetical protein LPJ66_001447 [Kickxella alabastrina]
MSTTEAIPAKTQSKTQLLFMKLPRHVIERLTNLPAEDLQLILGGKERITTGTLRVGSQRFDVRFSSERTSAPPLLFQGNQPQSAGSDQWSDWMPRGRTMGKLTVLGKQKSFPGPAPMSAPAMAHAADGGRMPQAQVAQVAQMTRPAHARTASTTLPAAASTAGAAAGPGPGSGSGSGSGSAHVRVSSVSRAAPQKKPGIVRQNREMVREQVLHMLAREPMDELAILDRIKSPAALVLDTLGALCKKTGVRWALLPESYRMVRIDSGWPRLSAQEQELVAANAIQAFDALGLPADDPERVRVRLIRQGLAAAEQGLAAAEQAPSTAAAKGVASAGLPAHVASAGLPAHVASASLPKDAPVAPGKKPALTRKPLRADAGKGLMRAGAGTAGRTMLSAAPPPAPAPAPAPASAGRTTLSAAAAATPRLDTTRTPPAPRRGSIERPPSSKLREGKPKDSSARIPNSRPRDPPRPPQATGAAISAPGASVSAPGASVSAPGASVSAPDAATMALATTAAPEPAQSRRPLGRNHRHTREDTAGGHAASDVEPEYRRAHSRSHSRSHSHNPRAHPSAPAAADEGEGEGEGEGEDEGASSRHVPVRSRPLQLGSLALAAAAAPDTDAAVSRVQERLAQELLADRRIPSMAAVSRHQPQAPLDLALGPASRPAEFRRPRGPSLSPAAAVPGSRSPSPSPVPAIKRPRTVGDIQELERLVVATFEEASQLHVRIAARGTRFAPLAKELSSAYAACQRARREALVESRAADEAEREEGEEVPGDAPPAYALGMDVDLTQDKCTADGRRLYWALVPGQTEGGWLADDPEAIVGRGVGRDGHPCRTRRLLAEECRFLKASGAVADLYAEVDGDEARRWIGRYLHLRAYSAALEREIHRAYARIHGEIMAGFDELREELGDSEVEEELAAIGDGNGGRILAFGAYRDHLAAT